MVTRSGLAQGSGVGVGDRRTERRGQDLVAGWTVGVVCLRADSGCSQRGQGATQVFNGWENGAGPLSSTSSSLPA